jgi:hypothetical protein
MNKLHRPIVLIVALAVIVSLAPAQGRITSPKQELGFNVGDDYQLINYTQLAAYWKRLAKESDRMKLVEIGKSSEGRPMLMAVISSPKNLGKLDLYKQISRRLALAQGLNDAEAKKLSMQGKAVVWIDGGLHATEIVGSQQLVELVYQILSGKDEETLRILDEVILLACPVNPDGQELVANWYMRDKDPLKRATSGLPRLYQKYVGHDNNRDYYMITQPETEAVSRQLYIEWHPQFLYNHHQSGPAGTVLFCPPFRDPFYYYFDPMVPVGTDLLGLAMHERFAAEGKPGAIMRSGASYSTWWNGGLRSTGYFHNVIGILTEIIGNPTPMDIPFIPDRVLPKGDYPYPIMPQKWHFRSSIDYSITADKAILDFAARRREEILYNRYVMGRNAIAKGSRDTWTFEPQQIAALQAQIAKDRAAAAPAAGAPPAAAGPGGGGMRGGGTPLKYYDMLRDPSTRDPRGFIISSAQADFPTATKFVNTLIKSGVTVHQATKPFTILNKTYSAGSYVVKTAQAFRAHVISMFEPQDHPNDFAYPGGPPRPPYDSAGWTVAFQMGIKFDRILEPFDGPFQEIKGFAKLPVSPLPTPAWPTAGFLLSHQVNDSAVVVNRLLKAKEEVFWLKKPFQTPTGLWPAGTIFIPNKPAVLPILSKAIKDLGVSFEAVDAKQMPSDVLLLKLPRVGVWDTYGGSMDSGWAQWILTQFEFPFEVVYAPMLDAGNLGSKYDVLVFVGSGIPGFGPGGRGGGGGQQNLDAIPQEYRGMIGSVTADKTIPQIRKFIEEGGTVLTVGGSTSLGYHLGLPIANHLVEKTPDGREVALSNQKYYVPGSILQVRVDNTNPIAYGMPDAVDVFFDNSPVFDMLPDAGLRGAQAAAWFESANPLRSGWVWGDEYLWRGVQVVTAAVGKGKVFLFGPAITFRGQPHGTFKFLFNGIFLSTAESRLIGGVVGGAKSPGSN